ncbi:hypothetical protein CMV_013566 [Castanea mollissima]|uniref:Uncharacterized protein n=1 Tax=Castanea mollissima TaxID=60419 RepID=A0A8J4QZI9_9ROSI|nr:hypothetical protein CMV_013566 [Castanea mollissima]
MEDMFKVNMEDISKVIPWVGYIAQKFEDMCLEMDEIVKQYEVQNDESQLEMESGNVRERSSEVMQDVLPPSSVDIEEVSDLSVAGNTDGTTNEKSEECIGEKHFKEGLSKGDHLLDSSSVEPVEDMDIGLSFEENVNTGIKKNPTKEKQTSGKKNSSMGRLSHQLQADNEMTLDSRSEMLLPFLDDVKGSNSFKKTAEEIDAQACDDSLSPDSVSLVESSESKVVEVELRWGDTSTQSIGRDCRSVDKGSGEDDVTKQGIQTVQPSDKVQLDESSVMVPYCSELYTVSCEESKDSSVKKDFNEAFASKLGLKKKRKKEDEQNATCYDDFNAELDQQRGKGSKSYLAENPDTPDQESSESDWEIV